MKDSIIRGIVTEASEANGILNLLVNDKSGQEWSCSDLVQVNQPADKDIKYNGWEFSCNVKSVSLTGDDINKKVHILLINPFMPWNTPALNPMNIKGSSACS